MVSIGNTSTKNKIFLAAAELFAGDCYADVSVRDIAEKVGIRPASIYNHYQSKEAILEDILQHYVNRINRFFQEFDKMNLKRELRMFDLETCLKKLIFRYEPHELQLMYWVTRIIHNEQFRSELAADILIGDGYKRTVEGHVKFFDALADVGIISGKENNYMYAEMISRLSLTFAFQFVHPEFEFGVKEMEDMYNFIFPLIQHYENRKKVNQRSR